MLITQANREHFNNYKDIYTHIISLVCPTDTMEPLHKNHLIYKMWDIDENLKSSRRRYDKPNQSDCINILTITNKWFKEQYINKSECSLLIHCDAGISRSSAVTLGVLWNITGNFFKNTYFVERDLLKAYMDFRKQACIDLLSDNSMELKRYIEGRLNPAVKPNQAILKYYRNAIIGFPW